MDNETRLWKAHHYISNQGNWGYWQYTTHSQAIDGLGRVEVLSTLEDSRTKLAYGEYDQGSTAPAGIVFKVVFDDGEVRTYLKAGTYDSYGDAEYNGGEFFEVAEVVKPATVYERVR